MKRIIFIGIAVLLAASCTKKQFADAYTNPSSVSGTTVAQQFAGVLSSNLNYVMYHYYDYFAVYQNTLIPWSQTAVTLNTNSRYLPGAAAVSDVWGTYTNLTAQYKDLLRVYASLGADEQKANRIYIIAATIYYYDFSQKVVDLWGDIPWSGAGLLGTRAGDYQTATMAAKYDAASAIYTKMLDDLKGFSDELNTISIPAAVAGGLNTQDFLNHGDMSKWKKYCNSLRIRMLTRASGIAPFQARAVSEIAGIVGNSTKYPVVAANSDNIMVKVVDPASKINNGNNSGSKADFYTGIIGWGQADRANKVMMDTMNNNADPRLRAMFEPGDSARGAYIGVDPTASSSSQNALVNGGTIARYNRLTLTQNIMLPGTLVNAAEIDFMLAEYYLNAGNDASARAAYEAGITQSVNYYYWLGTLNKTPGAPTLGPNDISNYIASPGIAWSGAANTAQKLNLIAIQKWINYSVLQPMECWAEIRRLKLPALNFLPDAGLQKLPPARWLYPTNEATYNAANYQAVQAKDNLGTKIFWDVK